MTFRKGIWLPILLLAFPLIVIGLLAIRSLSYEVQSLDAERSSLAGDYLRQTEQHYGLALGQAMAETQSHIADLAATLDVDGLRSFMLTGNVDFIAVYAGSTRLFPPESSEAQFITEHEELRLLAPYLAKVAEIPSGGTIYVSTITGPALLHCQAAEEMRKVCALMGTQSLLQILTKAGQDHGQNNWSITLIDPEGRRFPGAAPLGNAAPIAVLPLAEPLTGWNLQAQAITTDNPSWRWLSVVAIVVPLTISWLFLVGTMLRNHRTQMAEIEHRAQIAAQFSHELRTPLTNLGLYTDLIDRKAGDNHAIKTYCAIIMAEINRLGLLTENAISFAKGQVPADWGMETAIPDHVVQGVITNFAPMLDAAQCPVVFKGQAPLACGFNRAALERILINLLDNACKYAPNNPIDVNTQQTDTILHLIVRDYGPGIAAEKSQQMFKPLMRGDHPGQPGFGLGLAVVQQLASASGGMALVEAAQPGARFVVTLKIKDLSCVS